MYKVRLFVWLGKNEDSRVLPEIYTDREYLRNLQAISKRAFRENDPMTNFYHCL